jgi:hypothetical protein
MQSFHRRGRKAKTRPPRQQTRQQNKSKTKNESQSQRVEELQKGIPPSNHFHEWIRI